MDSRSLAALQTILTNLLAHPNDFKYRVLRRDNLRVRSTLIESEEASKVLERVGFVTVDETYLVFNGVVDGRVRQALEEMRGRPPPEIVSAPRAAKRIEQPRDDWNSVYGLGEHRREIESCQVVLLYGPPGCGKTKLAKCFAAQYGTRYLVTVRGPELRRHPSKRKTLFFYDLALEHTPCVLLIKELRTDDASELAKIIAKVRRDDDGVRVVVATNEYRALTPRSAAKTYASKLRVNRTAASGLEGFDALVYVPAPSRTARYAAIAAAFPSWQDTDVQHLADRTDTFSMRAVLETLAAAKREASRRQPHASVRRLDLEKVLAGLPTLASLSSTCSASSASTRFLISDWVHDKGLVWRDNGTGCPTTQVS